MLFNFFSTKTNNSNNLTTMTNTLRMSLQNSIVPFIKDRAFTTTSAVHYGKMKIGCVIISKDRSCILFSWI